MKTYKLIAIVFLFPVMMLTSCSDKDIASSHDESLFKEIQNDVISSIVEEDAFIIAEEAVNLFEKSNSSGNSGIEIVKKSNNKDFPVEFEVNFGSKFTDKNGNIYKGIINYTAVSKLERELKFDEFYVNNNFVEGGKRIHENSKGKTDFEYNIKIKDHNTDEVRFRDSHQQYSKTQGESIAMQSPIYTYSVSGLFEGNYFKNGKEIEYSLNIEQPITFVSGSNNILKGITLIRIGSATQYVNYEVDEKDAKSTWKFM